MEEKMLVYIGTYTGADSASKGIYACRMDMATGALSQVEVAAEIGRPSFLALHPHRPYLYAVSEVGGSPGKPAGGVSAFAADAATGRLTLLNQQSSQGAGPCHLSVDATGRFVLVANYSSGSVAMLPIRADGSLGPASDAVQHQGSSADPKRQEGPHAHSIIPDPANRFAVAADLGLDKLLVYRLDLENGKLIPNTPPWAQVRPASGPRHFDFHPNGKFGYLIDELNSTMIAFAYDATKGVLTELETVPTVPDDFHETNYCADVHVHPAGEFLYGSNRGHDTIVVYKIAQATGRLTRVGFLSSLGKWPRHFIIEPSGRFLLAANQNSDNVASFRIDQKTGMLTPTGSEVSVPKAICVRPVPLG